MWTVSCTDVALFKLKIDEQVSLKTYSAEPGQQSDLMNTEIFATHCNILLVMFTNTSIICVSPGF